MSRTRVLASLAALVLLAACRPASEAGRDGAARAGGEAAGAEAGGEEAARERPEGSDLVSFGPGSETRIYYQYIDDRGAVRFVDRLEDVPAQWRDRVGYLELDGPPPGTPLAAEQARASRRAKSGSRSTSTRFAAAPAPARSQPQVLLYYADWCGYCKKAKAHLDARSIDYELRDVDVPAVSAELAEKTGSRSIPVIEVDGRILKGYSEKALDELLDGAT